MLIRCVFWGISRKWLVGVLKIFLVICVVIWFGRFDWILVIRVFGMIVLVCMIYGEVGLVMWLGFIVWWFIEVLMKVSFWFWLFCIDLLLLVFVVFGGMICLFLIVVVVDGCIFCLLVEVNRWLMWVVLVFWFWCCWFGLVLFVGDWFWVVRIGWLRLLGSGGLSCGIGWCGMLV